MNNQAIDINHIFASNSKRLVETKIVKELEAFIEQQRLLSEIERKQTIYWVLRFLKFHNHQHPTDLAQNDIESFLSSLATENHYNQKLQKSAEKSIQYLYISFLKLPIAQLKYISVQQRKGYLAYFGANKCRQVANQLSGKSLLILELMLLGKLRLSEVAKLRESDVDIKNNRINIFDERAVYSNRKLLFTISIPLKLILDLRIQKMRIKQLFGRSSRYFNQSKNSKEQKQDNNLLFQSEESFFDSCKKVVKIKQAFKHDLNQAIVTINEPPVDLAGSRSDKRFLQLRMALDKVNLNRSVISRNFNPISNLKHNLIKDKNIQFELEVA